MSSAYYTVIASVAAAQALGQAVITTQNITIQSTGLSYTWNPASTATADGVKVIAVTGIATGRLILSNPSLANGLSVRLSQFASYAAAIVYAQTGGYTLIIDVNAVISANSTPTCNFVFQGGILTVNNTITLDLTNISIDASLTQIFDVSLGGVVKIGSLNGGSSILEKSARAPDIWVEWFGALPHITTSSQQTLNVNAFKAAFQSSASGKIGVGPGGFYFNGPINPTTSPYNGILEGRGRGATNLYFQSGSDGLVFTVIYNFTIKALTLWGGNRQIYLNIANVDETVITIDDMWFQTPAMWAVQTSSTSNSTLLVVKNSDWNGATGSSGFIRSHCDYTYCIDCWGEPNGNYTFWNESGNFYVTRFVGVGVTNPVGSSWAENYSSFYYQDCRLSDDGGGNRFTVNHRATPANLITFSINGGLVGNGGAPYLPNYVFYTLPQNLYIQNVTYSAATGTIQVQDLSSSDHGAIFASGICQITGPHFFYATSSDQAGQTLVAHSNQSAITPWFKPRLADVKWSYDSSAYLVESSSYITVGTAISANYLGGITLAKFTATADDAAVVISRTDNIVSTPLTDNTAYTASCDFLYTGSGPCTLSIQVYGSLRYIDLEPGSYRNVQIPFVKLTSGVPAGLIISASGMPNGAVLTPLRFTCQVGRAVRDTPNYTFFDSSANSITDTIYIGYYIGDRWDYSNPASAGFMGKTVTTAGTNGAETWKTFAPVS